MDVNSSLAAEELKGTLVMHSYAMPAGMIGVAAGSAAASWATLAHADSEVVEVGYGAGALVTVPL